MFVRSAHFVKTTKEWASLAPRGSFDSAARAYARANMVAVVMRGDDSAITYLYDVMNDRVSKKTYPKVEWA